MAIAHKEKWSAEVTEHSDALDLEEHVFEQHDPKAIAASLKRSAERSDRRKAEPFRSAMSMLTLHQPRRQEPAGQAEESAGGRQGRAARRLWPRKRGLRQSYLPIRAATPRRPW